MVVMDLAKMLKTLYTAKAQVAQVACDAGTFLAVDGKGAPGGDAFQQAIQCLFSVAYTAKFALKAEGKATFKVCPLECLYLSDPKKTPFDQWEWRMLLRIPDEVTAAEVKAAQRLVGEKRGMDVSCVKRIRWREGRAVQMLHVGPYNAVGSTYEKLAAYAEAHKLALGCPAHEIYLNDPRRLAPEKLKTIVRLSVTKRG